MWQIILGIYLFLVGIGSLGDNSSAFFGGTVLGGLLIYRGLKKKGFFSKQQSFTPVGNKELDAIRKSTQPHHTISRKTPPSHYVIFDIETTGFSRTNDRIIEIAAIEYVDGQPTNTFRTYVNPQRHIPNSITRLTGIRNSDVSEAPTIMEVKSDILRFFGSATLVGHNIKTFDIPFLEAQLNHSFSNPRIDTLHFAKDVFPDLPNYKLASLDHILGLGGLEHHRAENDIAMNNALFLACYNPKQYKHRISDPEVLNSLVVEQRDLSAKPDIHDFSPTNPSDIPDTPLTGKWIVFSGELNLLPEEAYQIAVDAGAILKTSISKKVDYLVQGYVEPRYLDENGWSSKQRTARKLIDSGEGKVKIIAEAEFLKLASPVPTK